MGGGLCGGEVCSFLSFQPFLCVSSINFPTFSVDILEISAEKRVKGRREGVGLKIEEKGVAQARGVLERFQWK